MYNNFDSYSKECAEFHWKLIDDGLITLDNIPQYVRIIENKMIYVEGYKSLCFQNKDNKNAVSWLIDFFRMVSDDFLAVSQYRTLDQLNSLEAMIYTLDNLLQYVEWDYGKNIRGAIESTLEKPVLRTLRAFKNKRQADFRTCIAEEISKKST